MARSTVRYGRTQATRSQRPSQSQPRTQARHSEATQEQQSSEEEVDGEEEEEEQGTGEAEEELVRKANMLVRLALFTEHKRVSLKRDEISKKVFNGRARDFKAVFAAAQATLRTVFGMELVEIMSRAEMEKEQIADLNHNENATGLKKKAAAIGSKAYILRSTLHPDIIELASRTDEQILDDEIPEMDDFQEEDDGVQTYGSIISWSEADQLGSIGILYVVLALILVCGGMLTDMDLKKHLKALRLPPNTHVEFTAQSTHRSMTIEAYLANCIRQNYLEKVKLGQSGAPRPTQGKRGRQSQAANDEEGVSYEWRWGARAQSEIGELGIGRFVAEFLVERTLLLRADLNESSDEEEEQQPTRNGRSTNTRASRTSKKNKEEEKERMLDAMMKSVARAAGGTLHDVR